MLKITVLYEAFRMFMERTRIVRGLPFPATLPESRMTRAEARAAVEVMRRDAPDAPGMPLEEIDEKIRAVRAEKSRKIEALRISRVPSPEKIKGNN